MIKDGIWLLKDVLLIHGIIRFEGIVFIENKIRFLKKKNI